jgi:3-hydroxyacyl-[acyl-carrier-protein] dehydratase
VPGKDWIIDPATIDLTTVVADLDEIRKHNPQRFEMEQLTAIVYEDMEKLICVGYKDVGADEFWARGHFPGLPLMPGVVMCEACAQLCSYFSHRYELLTGAKVVGLGGLDEVYFRGSVHPHSRMVITCQQLKVRPRAIIICRFQGFVNNELVVEGQMKGIPLPVDALAKR